MRTVGVEEELLLVDPATRQAVPRAPEVLKRLAEHHAAPQQPRERLDPELFRHQVEIQTAPVTEIAHLLSEVRAARGTAGRAAEEAGLALVAAGLAPVASRDDAVTGDDRYRAMVDTFGDVARSAGTCGLHVHVGVESDAEGVRVVDAVGPWLTLLLAISANSPYARGRDTGYASWRSQEWSRWPTAGPTAPFGDLATYRSVAEELIASGAARDAGMLYYDARLSDHLPTVEVRICDVPTDPHDTVLIAALVRALVESATRGLLPVTGARVELQRAARWRASRYGVAGSLLVPGRAGPVPAPEALAVLLDVVASALEDAGDTDLAHDGVARVLAGTGASRQRAAHERTGSVEGVVDDLLARTAASWS